ncbi:hypothetical protein [Gemmatimonas sp.]|jgi:hypothetical protein|uniref:hypothetical protein n=1 Tax=Gemmatimonas sp. TaxID=1962908 RepID=UPI0022BEC75F|nr:hypothetical protein [Gemmatimonas sp.]MCZ8204005.1 hypothetical protein [Gemmatimonas sp.]
MYKLLFALAVGIAIGYRYGWNDAQEHDKNVAERMIARISEETRERMDTQVDTRHGTGGK